MSSFANDFTDFHRDVWAGSIIADNLPGRGKSGGNTVPATTTTPVTSAVKPQSSSSGVATDYPPRTDETAEPATPGAAKAQAANEFLKRKAIGSGTILNTDESTFTTDTKGILG